MAPKQKLSCENYQFMGLVLWVDTSKNSGWQKHVDKLLNNIHGVTKFRMGGLTGMIQVSGTVNPEKLLKKMGKKLTIVKIQFGQCSNNLFIPPSGFGYGGGGGGGRGRGFNDGRFRHFDDQMMMNNYNNYPFSSNGSTMHCHNNNKGYYSNCSVGGNAMFTGCRVAKTAAYDCSAPHDYGGEISGCCSM